MIKDYNRQVIYLDDDNKKIRFINEFYSFIQVDEYTYISIDYRNILNIVIVDKIRHNFSYITISFNNIQKFMKPYYDFFIKNNIRFVSGLFGFLLYVLYTNKFFYISTDKDFIDFHSYVNIFSNLDYSNNQMILNSTDKSRVIYLDGYLNNYNNNNIYFTYIDDNVLPNKKVMNILKHNNLYFTYDFRSLNKKFFKTKNVMDVVYDNIYDNFSKHFLYKYIIKTFEKK